LGEFIVTGPAALDLIQKVTINDASGLVPGKVQYTAMCFEDGGLVDDLLVYRLDDDKFMMVVNASNIDKDWDWVNRHNEFEVEIENLSESTALLALQGPNAEKILREVTESSYSENPYYTFDNGTVAEEPDVLISATGYTGERGFELYMDTRKANANSVWTALLEKGSKYGLEPAGLGARDTLRLEMGLLLYGNDITKQTNPIEAGLGWLTKLEKGDFIGREALLAIKEKGPERKCIGFVIEEPRKIPRSGYEICDEDGNIIGFVTSGTHSITISKGIGLGYVPVSRAQKGETIYISIRKNLVPATVTPPPFIRQSKH
ncbi:MAG: glycine cleavage system aminomethyltransferase GcvT, partial [Balneolaceae bacterium]